MLISEHRDGEIIARIAERLGYRTVRGSTSRGAARALLGRRACIEQGGELAVTPDGPRGPARSRSRRESPIVAQRTGAPVIAALMRAHSRMAADELGPVHDSEAVRRVTIAYSDPLYVTAAEAREAAESVDRVAETMAAAERAAHG